MMRKECFFVFVFVLTLSSVSDTYASLRSNTESVNSNIVTVPDDAQSLNLAIAKVPIGGTVIIRGGIHSEPVYVNNSITLLGENNPRLFATLTITQAQNVTVKNIDFETDPPGTEFGIIIYNTNEVVLQNLTFIGTGIMIANSSNIVVESCTFVKDPGPSISIRGSGSKDIAVEWCIFNQTYAALSVHQGTNITFRYNTLNATSASVKLFRECSNATLYMNNFIGEAEDNGFNNKWFNSTLKLGNFWWDTSPEKDKNGDGIIDESRKIEGIAVSSDDFPLAKPFTEYLKSQNQITVITPLAAAVGAIAIAVTAYIYIKRRKKVG